VIRTIVSAAVFVAVMVGPAFGSTGSAVQVDMKVKVFVSPEQIEPIARQVLEFYEVTPEYFVGAVTRETYGRLVEQGYEVEVLVADMQQEASKYDGFFHTYDQIRDTWAIIAQNHSNICVLDTLGTSAGGYLLLAMKISDNPGQMEQEPRICFDFTIHGNENNGTEIAHWALLQILAGYGSDPDITRWVNEREIWLLPMVNPDGLVARRRYNDNGVDCNRNYGYAWDGGGSGPFSETETQALYHLGVNNPMSSWTQYHTGTTRAMWPWGNTELATMDSVVHRYEMERYEEITGYPSCQIARGLYPVNGGSTDWYYGASGSQGYGVEVCNGQPSPPSEIDTINHANWTAMQEMIERVMWGISGMVVDSVTDMPVDALVSVDPPDWFTYTDSTGYFHKNLHAGTYSVTVSANGYQTRTIDSVVVPADTFVFVDVALVPDTTEPWCAFQSITSEVGNSNASEVWWGLRARDGRRFSLERGGFVSYDMGRKTPIIDGRNEDFYVVEDDGDPESYTVSVSNGWNGPWQALGNGTGTQGFDLSAIGLDSARFVRIADGGTGFDLDAIEAVVTKLPEVVYMSKTVVDSLPGGNGDGDLDPGESADLILELKNVGRAGVSGLEGVLRTADTLVSILDSVGSFGDLEPDSSASNDADRFAIEADLNTPLEYTVPLMLYLSGTNYEDSIPFAVMVGEIHASDPIPDTGPLAQWYFAYDDGDVQYNEAPDYEWVEIRDIGTRLDLEDQQTVQVPLPAAFGPFKFYGESCDTISVCSNGWIAPGVTTDRAWQNRQLPTDRNRALLAVCWDDLYPPYGNGIWYYHDQAGHRFIVEYDSVHYSWARDDWDKFEVIIYDTTLAAEDGNSVFLYQYQSANNYVSASVGCQDGGDERTGVGALFDNVYHRGCIPLAPGRAIKFTTDAPRTGIEETVHKPVLAPMVAVLGSHFTGQARLQYSLPVRGRALVVIHDNSGRVVRKLVSGVQEAGVHTVGWDGTDEFGRRLPAGVYLVRFETGAAGAVTKTVLMR
jgi:hypothetical protein